MQLNSFIKLFGDINKQDKIILSKWNTISLNSKLFDHLKFNIHMIKIKPNYELFLFQENEYHEQIYHANHLAFIILIPIQVYHSHED